MAPPAKAEKTHTLLCVSTGTSTWSQSVASDTADVVVCTPEDILKQLDKHREQPIAVLAAPDCYDEAAKVVNAASSDRCLLGAIKVSDPRLAVHEVQLAVDQAQSKAAAVFATHNAGVPRAPYGVPWRPLLKEALDQHPSSIAARDEKEACTLAELHARASGVARAILTSVVHVHKPSICLFAPKNVTCVAGMMGALLAGYRFADVPAGSAAPEVRRLFSMIQPDVVLAVGSTVSRVPEAFQGNVVRLDAAAVSQTDAKSDKGSSLALVPIDGPRSFQNREADGAFCVLTSGTTAAAKLVVCPHAALMGCAGYMAQDGVGPGDAVGLFWLAWYMLPPMFVGASVFALPDKAFADPRLLLDFVRDEKLTVLYVTPSILKAVLDVEPDPLKLKEEFRTVRVVYCTGERLPSDLRARALKIGQHNLKVRNCYSTNEGGDCALDRGEGAASLPLLKDVHAEVLDLNGKATPIGAVGRLHVKGPALFRGYWMENGIRETPELYRTGDLVRWVGANRIEFCGREAGSHVKIRGFKVFPDLIESKIAEHPLVEHAWAGAVGANDSEMRLECAVAIKGELTSSSLRTWLRERLPPHMVPVVVRRVDGDWRKFRTQHFRSGKRPSGKKLAALLEGLPELSGDARELSPEAQRLARCWCSALKLPPSNDRFTGSSNFFDFGGSLAFVGLASSVEAEFGTKVPVGDLVAAPTLQGMVQRILGGESENEVFDVTAAASRHAVAVSDGLSSNDRRAAILAKASQRSGGAVVLVTGGTGYVGAFLCRALAERDNVKSVVAVVRASDDAKAAARLQSNCEGRLGAVGAWYGKVRAVAGDLGKADFGLSKDLVQTVDVVVHGAAEVNMVKPPGLLEAANVGGCKIACELALSARAPLLFTSTMLPLEGEAPTGYRLSKAAAEEVLEEASKNVGAVCATLQIGDLGFARRAGATLPEDDALVVLLRACLRMNAAPSDVDWAASVIPVDDFASKLAATALSTALDAEPFDAKPREAKGDLVRWGEVIDTWLPATVERVPFAVWRQRGEEISGYGDAYLSKLELLIEGLVDELHAEDGRRKRGEGTDGGWGRPDSAWAERFSAALLAATPALDPAPPLVGVSSSASLTDLAEYHSAAARSESSRGDGPGEAPPSPFTNRLKMSESSLDLARGSETRPASPTE